MMEGRGIPVDRISDLPNSLLTHILSFLATKEAVQTCILSKRWRDVWTSLSVLKFDDRVDVSHVENRECQSRFVRYVNGVLNHRQTLPLDTITLSWLGCDSCQSRTHEDVFEVLVRVVECMPRVISICSCTYSCFPCSIFSCVSLEEMSLSFEDADGIDTITGPESINLPSLKKVELDCIEIQDDFMKMLLLGCPLLEELVMSDCNLDVRDISSNGLKKITLDECNQLCEMQISCPGVVSLVLEADNLLGITLKNMSSLVNAEVVLEDVCQMNDSSLKLLGGLSNVTSLRLCTDPEVLDYLKWDIPNCPAMNNLECLRLGGLTMKNCWKLVACFLQHSPNLRKLALDFCEPTDDDAQEELLGDYFQHEYLETVLIECEEGNVKLAGEIVYNLSNLVKEIGRITIS